MKLIESKTLGTAQASIEFTSIPQDGTDLLLKMSLRHNTSSTFCSAMVYQFNSSTSGYSSRFLVGPNALSPASGTRTTLTSNSITGGGLGDGFITPSNATSDTFASVEWYIPNYTSSAAKSSSLDAVSESNGTSPVSREIIAALWTGTDPITSVIFTPRDSFSFVAGCQVSLYKITKGSDGIVTTS
jgi:hypothetical protein